MRGKWRFAIAMVVLGLGALAHAQEVPALQIQCITDAGYNATFNPQGTPNGDGESFTYDGSYYDEWGTWDLDWHIVAKPDPYINAVYGLTNMTGVVQNFTLIVTLPVAPTITPTSLYGGSTGGSVNDVNGVGGATAATVGPDGFYNGLIDGATILSLYPHVNSWSAPFQYGTGNIPASNAGLPGPTLPGPAVLTDIGIRHHFSLTPGDTIAITSLFVVTPEPASLAMLGLGALLLRRR